jgi:hypothetical protein
MQEMFDKLQQLQEILSEKFQIEKEINEIPKKIDTKSEILNRLKKTYIDRNQEYDSVKERIISLKHDLHEAERLREDSEKKMDMISTQREYESLDKEIKDAAEKEQKLRWDIQKEEKKYQEMTDSLAREEQMIKMQEEELAQETKKIEKESADKKKSLDKLQADEKKLTPGIDEDILFKFERIIRNKSGVGIVPVINDVCTGCHMILPGQFVNEIRKGEDILFCPYCSRILFYKEAEKEAAPEAVTDEVGGLADLVNEADFQ